MHCTVHLVHCLLILLPALIILSIIAQYIMFSAYSISVMRAHIVKSFHCKTIALYAQCIYNYMLTFKHYYGTIQCIKYMCDVCSWHYMFSALSISAMY